MKRKNNIYNNICDMENIIEAVDKVFKSINNPKKKAYIKKNKSILVSSIYNTLCNKSYISKPKNLFYIYEPKKRKIRSLQIIDKIINTLISKQILYPALLPSLIDQNVASRPKHGTSKGKEYLRKYLKKADINYGTYYILKCDIHKFFASINHKVLKEKLKRKIKDKEALDIIFRIIDSDEEGLSLGSMTSQTLAIFYLNDMDWYIKQKLRIKYYVRYQDDFILIHRSKKYLKECKRKIEEFLKKEKLELNKSTRIYKSSDNFSYLGETKRGQFVKRRKAIKKIKAAKHDYINNKISLSTYIAIINSYASRIGSKVYNYITVDVKNKEKKADE